MRFKQFYLQESSDVTIPKILYHGSNYDFSKFDLSHVGKGEGLQKFGFGVYLTDTENLSNFYATQLKGTQIIYQCRIPSDSRLYEWDSPVDDFLHNKFIKYLTDNDFEEDAEKLQDEYEQYNEYMDFKSYYKILSHLVGSPKKASEAFVKFGIDGCVANDIQKRGIIYVIFDASLIKIIDKDVLNESEEQTHLGYKIVNFDGKEAYSIADKKVKYSLKKNDIHAGNIYLGTSKKYATEYYSTDSDDPEDPEELLLTYQFSPSDIKKGNIEDKDYMTGGSEIIVSKAKLVSVYNITKKKILVESEERKLLKNTRTGKIYELPNGNILKISNDELEYKNAKILINKSSKQFVKYYSVEKVDGKYEMEQERIIPLKDNEVEIVDLIQNSLGDSDYFLNDTRRNKFIQELKKNEEWYETFATYKEVYKFIMEIYKIYKEGNRLGIDLFNINSENVGHTKDGRLVAFDLGN